MNIKKELVLKLLENDFFRKSSGDQIGMIFDNLNSYYYNKFNLLLGNNMCPTGDKNSFNKNIDVLNTMTDSSYRDKIFFESLLYLINSIGAVEWSVINIITKDVSSSYFEFNDGKITNLVVPNHYFLNYGKVIKDIHKDVNDNFLSYVRYNPSRNVMARFLSY